MVYELSTLILYTYAPCCCRRRRRVILCCPQSQAEIVWTDAAPPVSFLRTVYTEGPRCKSWGNPSHAWFSSFCSETIPQGLFLQGCHWQMKKIRGFNEKSMFLESKNVFFNLLRPKIRCGTSEITALGPVLSLSHPICLHILAAGKACEFSSHVLI